MGDISNNHCFHKINALSLILKFETVDHNKKKKKKLNVFYKK